jgi:hypothetical protein
MMNLRPAGDVACDDFAFSGFGVFGLLALTALKLSSLTLTSLGELMLSKSAFV